MPNKTTVIKRRKTKSPASSASCRPKVQIHVHSLNDGLFCNFAVDTEQQALCVSVSVSVCGLMG